MTLLKFDFHNYFHQPNSNNSYQTWIVQIVALLGTYTTKDWDIYDLHKTDNFINMVQIPLILFNIGIT